MLLAAGASRRFGGQKLLAPLAGRALVRRAAERVVAADVAELIVVLGHESEAVRAALRDLNAGPGVKPVRFTLNRRYTRGLAVSLRCGIRAVSETAAAAVVALGDQPSVDPAVIDLLISAWRGGATSIVAPSYHGFRGNPVLFDRSLFAELLHLRGDEGARRLIADHASHVTLISIEAPPPHDVDTRQDLRRVEVEPKKR